MLNVILDLPEIEVNPQTCLCRDCNQALDIIAQPTWNNAGYITLFTCWNPDCSLSGFTLSSKQYDQLTEAEWEEYRAMSRKLKGMQP